MAMGEDSSYPLSVLIRQTPGHQAGRHRAWRSRTGRRTLALHGVVGVLVSALLGTAGLLAALGGMFATIRQTPTNVAALAADRDSFLPRPPANSGNGRRIVFDQSDQRVWLVASDGNVERSYLVIGSNRDNVSAGAYRVQSKTRYASAYNGSGQFEFFVRFTTGRRAPIGFHSITVKRSGELAYARADLGTARTPGCIELVRDEAASLWEFAPVGTPVVVTV